LSIKKLPALLILALTAGLLASSSYANDKSKDKDKDKNQDKNKTFTGVVGDALCGREHSMSGTSIECIRECIGKGGNYALIVGDKVYTLETKDKTVLDMLEKHPGEKVTVTGVENGTTILVTSVKPVS
jgi:hypothetical protein